MRFWGCPLRTFLLLLATFLIWSAADFSHQAQAQGDQVYRVIILDNQPLSKARQGKQLLESWGYAPIILDVQDGNYRVLYGNFITNAAAARAKQDLENQGILAQGISAASHYTAPPATPATDEKFTIQAREFNDPAQAEAHKAKLINDFSPVTIRQVGRFYHVLVGSYSSDEAAQALGQLRMQGYTTAKVIRIVPAGSPPAPTELTRPAASASTAKENSIPPSITQTEQWRRLSDDQKRQVIISDMMEQQLRSGDPVSQVAGEVIDINKRLKNLDNQVQDMIGENRKAKAVAEKKRQQIMEHFDYSENLIRSGKYEDAILSLTMILNDDPNDQFGQKAVVGLRIAWLKNKLKGESYEGESEDIEKQKQVLEEQAKRLSNSNQTNDLERAIGFWDNIKLLDPNKYGQTADAKIDTLTRQLNSLHEAEKQTQAGTQRQYLIFAAGVVVAVLIVIVLLILVWIRGRKRHMELLRRVQEITSIRPMRELDSSSSQALLGESFAGGETDIFSPRNPEVDGMQPGDPLGGLAESDAPLAKGKGKKADKKADKKGDKKAPPPIPEAPKQEEDVFGLSGGLDGGFSESLMASPGDDMGLDDIFSTPTPATAEPPQVAEEEPEAKPAVELSHTRGADLSDVNDIFANLFSDDSEENTETSNEPAAVGAPAMASATPAAAPAPAPAKEDLGPISFNDIVSVASSHQTESAPAAQASDLLSVFDGEEPPVSSSNGGITPPPVDDRLKDSPFLSMFGDDSSAGNPTKASTETITPEPLKEDDTEIPSIKLDLTPEPETQPKPAEVTSAPISFGDFNADQSIQPSLTDTDLPTFSFDDLINSAAPEETVIGPAGIELSFENESVGQKPGGWEGDYGFASLSVQADTPPKGTNQYLAFDKKEGAGKALYTYHFGNINGVVGIEFDLRCNDKNKFLLGFYIEKDGDFQQSIHTKILRSEAQTTPTIHMQGESAPYLLGSWAHIKYVVDLNLGKLNGYIDSTHVVRDLPLQQNPGYLNTLSIRDNINTTGNLLLANIKVYKA